MKFQEWVYAMPSRMRAFFRANQADQDMKEELREHRERQTSENIALGMSPEEARRAAMIALGGMTQVEQQCRDARGGRFW